MNEKETTKAMLRGKYVVGRIYSWSDSGSGEDMSTQVTITLRGDLNEFKHEILADGNSGEVIITMLD